MSGLSQRRTLTTNEATERFPDLLRRVEDRGESFTIARNGQEIAELRPTASRVATLGTFREALRNVPPVDEDFARDLDLIRSEQPKLPEDPWES